MNEILKIRHLSKAFGKNVVLRDIDFTVNKGDVISIIGASGSGKSTLLRCINLLETPTSGRIVYREKDVEQVQKLQQQRYFLLLLQFLLLQIKLVLHQYKQ